MVCPSIRQNIKYPEHTVYKYMMHIHTRYYTCKYLDVITTPSHRVAFTRLITSSHRLCIETSRWQTPSIPRLNRICTTCNELDDEYHFLLECQLLNELRKRFISPFYWKRPSMFKCVKLLNSSCKKIKMLAKFIYLGFSLKT